MGLCPKPQQGTRTPLTASHTVGVRFVPCTFRFASRLFEQALIFPLGLRSNPIQRVKGTEFPCGVWGSAPTSPHAPTQKAAPQNTTPLSKCCFYFANSVQRVSRMTLTLIWPGYSSSFSMRLAISRASTYVPSSEMSSGLTMMRTSRPD